jgi:hypothetical protein
MTIGGLIGIEWKLVGETVVAEKAVPVPHIPHDLTSNAGRHGMKPATNLLR